MTGSCNTFILGGKSVLIRIKPIVAIRITAVGYVTVPLLYKEVNKPQVLVTAAVPVDSR